MFIIVSVAQASSALLTLQESAAMVHAATNVDAIPTSLPIHTSSLTPKKSLPALVKPQITRTNPTPKKTG